MVPAMTCTCICRIIKFQAGQKAGVEDRLCFAKMKLVMCEVIESPKMKQWTPLMRLHQLGSILHYSTFKSPENPKILRKSIILWRES